MLKQLPCPRHNSVIVMKVSTVRERPHLLNDVKAAAMPIAYMYMPSETSRDVLC